MDFAYWPLNGLKYSEGYFSKSGQFHEWDQPPLALHFKRAICYPLTHILDRVTYMVMDHIYKAYGGYTYIYIYRYMLLRRWEDEQFGLLLRLGESSLLKTAQERFLECAAYLEAPGHPGGLRIKQIRRRHASDATRSVAQYSLVWPSVSYTMLPAENGSYHSR